MYVDRFNRTYSIWIKITIVIAIAIALLLCLKLGVVVFQKLRKVKLASKDKHKQLIDEINASSFENY